MKKINISLIATALLFSASAQASYVFSCDLTGEIVTKPDNMRAYYNNQKGQEVERLTSRFMFSVSKAAPGGRADGDCKTYIKKEIEVVLETSDFARLKKNATLRVNVMVADGELTQLSTRFNLLD